MGVLHKDLKPANVLMRLDAAGNPAIILTDFGSGRALDPARLDAFGITRPAPDPTAQDTTGGTHIYRAPESFTGAAPTAQADIFALGVMLFQLAAGDLRRPLAAGWEEAIADPLLREDIAAAAAGDPVRRLADAGVLAARLRALPERRAARARAEAAEAEAARARRALEIDRARRAARLALVGVLLAGLAAGVGVVGGMMTLDQSFHNVIDLRAMGRPVIGAISLAALPPTMAMRLRHAAVFGSSIGLLIVVMGGVLLHFTQHI